MAIDLSLDLREEIENTLRCLTLDAVQRAGIGHVGAPLGLARPVFELWDRCLRFDPVDPRWPLRDRFVLSNGHASMLLYGLLHLFGYDLPMAEIGRFRQLGSRTPGHPEYGETPGVEMTTGPLGQGFAHGVGMALAGRLTAARYGGVEGGPGGHFVYGVVSDGDLMEGVSSEASSFAGTHRLGNLVYLFDDNRITIDGPTELTFTEDVAGRFTSHGWHVESVDGEDYEGLAAALSAAREEERPSLIVTRTTIGHGSPNFAGQSKAHGGPYGEDENRITKQGLGWPVDSELFVPDRVRAYMAERVEAKKADRQARDVELEAWRVSNSERASAWDAALERKLPPNLGDLLCEGMEGVSSATRKHSATVLDRLWDCVPNMVGGSADLAGSAAPPIISKVGIVGPGAAEGNDPFAGGNVHFGVREHAMAAITNGIALDGTLIPYCGTFMIFSDYMRPSIRLAALMKARSVFVFTHDSIFVGEDGPTHQPVEQLDSLRAVPNFPVFRPADGIETAMAYAWILECADGPAMLALTRQDLPALERASSFDRADVWLGGYVLKDTESAPDAVLVATGSEVPLSCAAADLLAEQGVRVRVVSLPCLELFRQQSREYQELVVPDDGTPLVAVEAGLGESLRSVVGRKGLLYGMKGFGASAPWKDLADHFGFVPEKLAKAVAAFVRG